MSETILPDSESQARCRELFGSDFFGMREAAGQYGYVFTEQQVEQRKRVRILRDYELLTEGQSWDAIRRCHEENPGRFVCCVGIPHSVCDVHALFPGAFKRESYADTWFTMAECRAVWSEKAVDDFWFLLRKEVLRGSINVSPCWQRDWLKKNHPYERLASAQHVVFGHALCSKATNGKFRLYSGRWGVTNTWGAVGGYIITVGCGPLGLVVDSVWRHGDHRLDRSLGAASLWVS